MRQPLHLPGLAVRSVGDLPDDFLQPLYGLGGLFH